MMFIIIICFSYLTDFIGIFELFVWNMATEAKRKVIKCPLLCLLNNYMAPQRVRKCELILATQTVGRNASHTCVQQRQSFMHTQTHIQMSSSGAWRIEVYTGVHACVTSCVPHWPQLTL